MIAAHRLLKLLHITFLIFKIEILIEARFKNYRKELQIMNGNLEIILFCIQTSMLHKIYQCSEKKNNYHITLTSKCQTSFHKL